MRCDHTCPLGDDCDLTLAWMAGQAEARDRYRAKIEQLETQLGLARIDADQQRERATAAEAALAAHRARKASGSVKYGPDFPPRDCTAWEGCHHDGVCHDANCSARKENENDR